jgi:hypothetical protein
MLPFDIKLVIYALRLILAKVEKFYVYVAPFLYYLLFYVCMADMRIFKYAAF